MAGGRGDLAAAAKVINLMQRMCPELTFDWLLFRNVDNHDPKAFLSNPSNVNIIKSGEKLPSRKKRTEKFFSYGSWE